MNDNSALDLSLTEQAMSMLNPGQARKGEHYVRFYMEPVQDAAASLKEGRPIFQDVEHIEIRAPGNSNSIIVREVRDSDKKLFASQYAAWKKGAENQNVGTPLAAWPILTKSQVEELKYFGVHTVEQLAAMSDSNIQAHMGLGDLKRKAQLFLAAAKNNASLEQFSDALLQRDTRIDTLERQLRDALEQIKILQSDVE